MGTWWGMLCCSCHDMKGWSARLSPDPPPPFPSGPQVVRGGQGLKRALGGGASSAGGNVLFTVLTSLRSGPPDRAGGM